MRTLSIPLACVLLLATPHALMAGGRRKRMTPEERIALVLREAQPLAHPLGTRLPLYVWAVLDVPGDDAQIERTLKALTARGIAACATWRPGKGSAASLERALRIGAAQRKLGLRVNINANACTYSVFDGSPETAHVDAEGKPFFDTSSAKKKLGCPFSVKHRTPAMREQVESFVRAYKARGIPIGFVFADWEIDGPIEWNDGFLMARRCVRCRKHIPGIDDFAACQKVFRSIRADLTRTCYVRPILDHFPDALVGNYGVYPHDGWRYWYDYFEAVPTDPRIPVRRDQRAVYRPWPQEFGPSGYTYAMPVVYTRADIWRSYDWKNDDFRWAYNLLLQVSSVGKHTPAATPIVSFVNYTSCSKPKGAADPIVPFTRRAYKELLWHMLLRGHDAFFLWCPEADIAAELKPLHEVFAASLKYREFLDKGTPVTFDVPKAPGPVVSALRLGSRLLVRRTDFTEYDKAVILKVNGTEIAVPRRKGACQELDLGSAKR